jgi:SAM-dependent methyltransferase
MDPQQIKTAETFDLYKDNYSQSVDDAIAFTGMKTDVFTKVKSDYILDLVAPLSRGAKSLDILDIGCGVGNYHSLLSGGFKSITGVDVSGACIETARKRNQNAHYEVYDGDVLPFESASFDVAVTICVMHHVPPGQWQKFAQEMHRVLKPGGLALVFEHNPRNPLTMRAVNNCPFDEDAVLMRSEVTKDLLANAGFKKIDVNFILSVPPLGTWSRQVDKWFSGIPLGAQYYVAGYVE